MSRARVLSLERRMPRLSGRDRLARVFGEVMTPEERAAYLTMALHSVGNSTSDQEHAVAFESIARMNEVELRGMVRRLGSYFVKRLADHERFDPTCGKSAQRRERAR